MPVVSSSVIEKKSKNDLLCAGSYLGNVKIFDTANYNVLLEI